MSNLCIELKDRFENRDFKRLYQFGGLPNKIRDHYGSMDCFKKDIDYILSKNLRNRLKIHKNG
jgi:hypothetical protein